MTTLSPPSRARLMELARRFAREIHAVEPPEFGLQERIEYVIWGRKAGWAQVECGEMSKVELRALLLDHFDYECADVSGRSMTDADPEALASFIAELDAVLFANAAADEADEADEADGAEPKN